jgi:hypothetical protein
LDPVRAKKFVYGEATAPEQPAKSPAAPPAAAEREGKGQPSVSRTPFTTRVRTDFAAALKRASLERQLNGQFPNTLQDILEEALEPWLRANGYLN